MTGSLFVIEFFLARGIERVFAYPGANVLPLYGELICAGGIKSVLVRHEQNAAFAASGYAKASGRPGVCIATSGPGATNLITGIADAYLDSTPLIAVTGQVDRKFIGRDAFQEADIMGMTIPITKHNYLVKNADELPRILDEAYRIATTGRKGPVLIDITHDVFMAEICEGGGDNDDADYFRAKICESSDDNDDADYFRENNNPVFAENYSLEEQIDSIRAALANSYRPLILAGGGVVSAHASFELAEFSRKSGIPVATTLMGKGIALRCDGKNLGMAGIFGTREANSALNQCDLLIAVGTRFSDRTIQNYEQCSRARVVIHCDIDAAEIDKNVESDIGVVADAAVFISALTSIVSQDEARDFNYYTVPAAAETDGRQFDEHAVMTLISECVAEKGINPIYVTDVGDNQMAAAKHLRTSVERGFVTSGGLGAMGFGLPAGIGAAYAVLDADSLDEISTVTHTIVISGDAGFQMTMQELASLKDINFPVVLIIVDNSSLGMIEHLTGDSENYRIENPDFVSLVGAYGINAVRADSHEKFKYAVVSALEKSTPSVIIAVTK